MRHQFKTWEWQKLESWMTPSVARDVGNCHALRWEYGLVQAF